MPSLHAYATQVEPFRASTTSDLPGALMQVVIEAQWFAGFGVRDAMLQCKRHAWRPTFSPALTLWPTLHIRRWPLVGSLGQVRVAKDA